MTSMYVIGYSGTVVSRERLLTWKHYERLEDEFARRLLAAMDASIAAGTPFGIGSSLRREEQQLSLFLSRHHEVKIGGCCVYNGKRWRLNRGAAHAAPPGRSMHEDTTLPTGECLATDTVGKSGWEWLKVHAAEYGLRSFWNVNNEPWHVQPIDVSASRRLFEARRWKEYPLKVWTLPGATDDVPPVQVVEAPTPTIRLRRVNNRAEVRELQALCNFYGWRDAYGRELLVDGDYGAKSYQACRTMQRALKVPVDGVYGPMTARTLQAFLNEMGKVAA